MQKYKIDESASDLMEREVESQRTSEGGFIISFPGERDAGSSGLRPQGSAPTGGRAWADRRCNSRGYIHTPRGVHGLVK